MRGVLLRCRRRIPQTSCPACRTSTTNTGEARWMVSRRHGLRQRPSNRTHAIMRHAQAIQSAKFVWSRTAEDSAVRASHTCHRGNCSGEAQVWTPCSSQSSLSPRALVFAVGAGPTCLRKGPEQRNSSRQRCKTQEPPTVHVCGRDMISPKPARLAN